jgi:hypothetical protein
MGTIVLCERVLPDQAPGQRPGAQHSSASFLNTPTVEVRRDCRAGSVIRPLVLFHPSSNPILCHKGLLIIGIPAAGCDSLPHGRSNMLIKLLYL